VIPLLALPIAYVQKPLHFQNVKVLPTLTPHRYQKDEPEKNRSTLFEGPPYELQIEFGSPQSVKNVVLEYLVVKDGKERHPIIGSREAGIEIKPTSDSEEEPSKKEHRRQVQFPDKLNLTARTVVIICGLEIDGRHELGHITMKKKIDRW